MTKPSIAVVITKIEEHYFGPATYRPYVAMVLSNPALKANGETEQEALDRLKAYIISHVGQKFIRLVDLQFDELIVKEVMDG